MGRSYVYTVEYTRAFLYSDWLYYLWRGINNEIVFVEIKSSVTSTLKGMRKKQNAKVCKRLSLPKRSRGLFVIF